MGETTIVVIPKGITQAQTDKLAAIEAGAEVNPADLAALDATASSKLAGIEAGADVNPADLADLDATASSKLAGIEAGADVNPTDTDGLPESATKKYVTANQKNSLETNEVQYVAIEKLAEAPASPTEGRLYYDTALSKYRLYKDSAWVDATFCADVMPS